MCIQHQNIWWCFYFVCVVCVGFFRGFIGGCCLFVVVVLLLLLLFFGGQMVVVG